VSRKGRGRRQELRLVVGRLLADLVGLGLGVAVKRFGLEVGTESRGHYVRKFGVGGCVKSFAKSRGGFVALSLTADCYALKEVVVALLRLVARWTPVIVRSFVSVEIFSRW
jgi:hypothetical protein